MAAYIGRLGPDGSPPYPEGENLTTAHDSYHRGRQLGLRWKDKLCLFAFLVRITGGDALTEPAIEAALTEPGGDPHHALDEIFRIMKIANQAEG